MSVVVHDYGVSSGAVSVSVAEIEAIQLVMMCEGATWDGVTGGGMGTTAVISLQSENRYSSTWEHSGTALSCHVTANVDGGILI